METIVSNWDKPNLSGIFIKNLNHDSKLLGYTSTTEYIDPVDLFIEKEPELASKLIIYWVDKPDGLKTVFEGMYKIVDIYAHSYTNKSKPVTIEKNYNEDMFKSLVGKKLSTPAVNAITEHFYGKQPVDAPTITPGTPKPPKMPKLPKGAYKEPKAPKPVKEPSAPKAPRKPRVTKPKETAAATTTSLITPAERAAINALQAKIIKETEAKSTLYRAIKGKLARNAVKKASAASTIGRMVKARVIKENAITVPIPKTKKEKAPKYKLSYAAALKQWNMSHSRGMWCNPRKGTEDYKAVVSLRL